MLSRAAFLHKNRNMHSEFLVTSWSNYQRYNVTQVLNSCLIALQNNNVKVKIPFQHFCLLIVKVRTLQNFCSKTGTCNVIVQKIHKIINYQPKQFLNVSIHPIEHIEVKHKLF